MSREAMKLALEALEERYVGALRDKAIDALRAALDAPEPEPVWIQRTHLEWARREPSMCRVEPTQRLPDFIPLYPAPTPVAFFCLTTQEVLDIVDDHTEKVGGLPMLYRDQAVALARNIEAKLKDRNAY